MAELSFGHNLRAKRKEVVNNTLSFLPWAQGCLTACAPANASNALDSAAPANTIHFNNAPAKMLGVALHEYGSPHQFKVQLCNLPRELRSGELLVQVQAAGVNPTDCKLRSGALQQLYPLSLPCILGCDFSGLVIKAGADAKFSAGDVVFGRQTLERIREVNGTYAEYVVVDANDVAKKPDDVSFEQAAAVPWAGLTAFAALVHVGGITYKNDTGGRRAVLILGGSGGVGTFAVQLSKHYLRCHTVATCSSTNAELVRNLGADEVLDYNDDGVLQGMKLPDLGQGRAGFSMVLDCVGGDDYWDLCQKLLVEGGTYVTLVGPERYGGDYSSQVSVGSGAHTTLHPHSRALKTPQKSPISPRKRHSNTCGAQRCKCRCRPGCARVWGTWARQKNIPFSRPRCRNRVRPCGLVQGVVCGLVFRVYPRCRNRVSRCATCVG